MLLFSLREAQKGDGLGEVDISVSYIFSFLWLDQL
jgi:hypothetical protein